MAVDGDRRPRQPSSGEPIGAEGGWTPSLVRLDGHDHDGPVVSALAPAGPRVGQATRLAGTARTQLSHRTARRFLFDYVAAAGGPAVLSLAKQGPGSGGLLDRVGGDR